MTPTDAPGDPIRLPAGEIEQLVIKSIVHWAQNENNVLDAVGWHDAKLASDALKQAQRLIHALQHDPKPALLSGVSEVEIGPTQLRISLDLIGAGLQQQPDTQNTQNIQNTSTEVVIEVPVERKRCGLAVRLVIGEQGPQGLKLRSPDPTLVALMLKGKVWLHRLTFGGQGIAAIAEQEKVHPKYVSRVINVALLAPDIVQAIERGEQPVGLNATQLLTSVPFPMDWQAQRAMLGMG